MIINFFISRHEKKEMSQAWEKSYGKANWSEEEVEDEFTEEFIIKQLESYQKLLDSGIIDGATKEEWKEWLFEDE